MKTRLVKTVKINLQYINHRICKEVCEDTINILTDQNLITEYKKSKSVQNKIKKIKSIFEKNNIEMEKQENILNDYILELIPPGTKGVIRGNKFNEIVKNYINNLQLDNEIFEIVFEKKCKLYETNEIPDWYILEKKTGKAIIGMNQLDLWSGGQQLNRGFKYLNNNKINTEKSKLLCVVCNKIQIQTNKNKTYKIFEMGFSNDTLCYINNIANIVNKYFKYDKIIYKNLLNS